MDSKCAFDKYCTLCLELRGDKSTLESVSPAFLSAHPDGRILRSAENWVVMPTLGALAVGHILLVSSQHAPSSAYFSDTVLVELYSEMQAVRATLEPSLGPLIFFEHGSMGASQRSGACTDHAHIHAIPIESNSFIKATNLRWERLSNISSLKVAVETSQPYLYIQDELGIEWKHYVMKPLPCQFLRRVAADLLNCPEEWDWFVFPRMTEVQATMDTFRRAEI